MVDLQAQIDALRERVERLEGRQFTVLHVDTQMLFRECPDCGAHMTFPERCYDTVAHWVCPKCGKFI